MHDDFEKVRYWSGQKSSSTDRKACWPAPAVSGGSAETLELETAPVLYLMSLAPEMKGGARYDSHCESMPMSKRIQHNQVLSQTESSFRVLYHHNKKKSAPHERKRQFETIILTGVVTPDSFLGSSSCGQH